MATKTSALGYMARDQYGRTYDLPGAKHPRKALLEQLDRKHANKMYIDLTTGGARHVGWVIGGLWLNVYRIESLN